MKTLVVTTFFSPHISGLTLYVDKFSRVLKSLGHTITILTQRHDPDLPLSSKTGYATVERLPVNLHISKSPFSFGLFSYLFQNTNKFDLVVINLPSLESVFVSLWAKILGKKILAIHHCDPIVPGNFGGFFTFAVTLTNLISCFLADKIITYTTDYAQNSPVLKHFLDKVAPVLPPVEIERPSLSKIKKLKAQIGSTKNIIGFAGRFSYDKGIKYLLESVPYLGKSLSDFKIIFAGPLKPIGESYYDQLSDLIEKHKKHLVFLGSIPAMDMVNFYKTIDVLVLPSVNRTESFGMVQVEALLAGVPVVASDIPGVRQTVKITGGGDTAPPRHPQKLSQSITRVLKNRKQYRPRNLNLFSLQNYQKQLTKLLNDI